MTRTSGPASGNQRPIRQAPSSARPAESGGGAGLPKTRGSEFVASELRRSITEGDYEHGEQLPAERDLAQLFGVARSTVRKALLRLQKYGLVTRQIGSGTFVSYTSEASGDEIAEITSPLKVVEVRRAVEPLMTRLAVRNAGARDLDLLGESLARVMNSGDDPETFTRWDAEFHQRLANCSHNPLLAWVYRHINEVRSHAQWSVMRDKILVPERIAEYNRQHSELYESLRSRDTDRAVKIITEHLEIARRDLLGADSD